VSSRLSSAEEPRVSGSVSASAWLGEEWEEEDTGMERKKVPIGGEGRGER
jgi:hypothetical protein